MPVKNISIVVVICGTVLMALAVDAESFLHDNLKDLLRELKSEGMMVSARKRVRKWPYWVGLFLIGAGTALNWQF